jgi:DNA-binding SARP family transcriptional activator
MTERLELALLGRISVRLDGEPLDDSLTSSKARALLSYLSVTGRSHPRQAIATLLWPQLSLSDARRNLRGVLMSLRRTVGAHLEINNHSLALNQSSDYWLDVNLFRASLELPPGKEPLPEALRQALALYRGDFLEDLYVRQSPPFDEWVGELRTHLKELAVGACWALANHYAGIHDFDSAVANARRSVSLDPLSEVGWQLTMRFLALNGQRNQALSLYEELRAFLKSELSVPPSAETELLLEEIRSGWVGKARLDPARARGAIRVAPSGEKTRVRAVQTFATAERCDRRTPSQR